MFTPEQITLMQAKLDPANVFTREQGRSKLSYIESWRAISEANRIFGFDGWSSRTIELKCVLERERKVGKPPYERDGWGVSYVAKVLVTVGGVEREGSGCGHGIDVDMGLAHESALKEAESDARKRALMTFGNPFGLALYDKTQANVGREPATVDVKVPPAATTLRDGLKIYKPTGRTSANSLKQDKSPDNWDAFEQELAEVKNVSDLTKLALSWSSISERDIWPTKWHTQAKNMINERREELINGVVPDDDVFPGDRPPMNDDEVMDYLTTHPVNAG